MWEANGLAYVYMVRCRDGSYYSGYAADPVKRVKVHNSGHGAKYTRSRLPVELVYWEELPDKSAALRREAALKKMTHLEKARLVRAFSESRAADPSGT